MTLPRDSPAIEYLASSHKPFDCRSPSMPISEVNEAFDDHLERIPPWFIDLSVTPFKLVDRHIVKNKSSTVINSIIETDIEQHTSYANQRREDVIRNLIKGVVKYAVLSHVWRENNEEEFTYQQMLAPDADVVRDGPGWNKLKRFIRLAKDTFGCQFAWVDTVCVDRNSPSDQQAAATYGFDWFRNAHVCVVYLAHTRFLSELEYDPWFRRGWPLTELLASTRMKFYGVGWEPLNDRCPTAENDKADSNFLRTLSRSSGISVDDLRFFLPGPNRIREKLSWASKRETTRPEDRGYCLISIFSSGMKLNPGEGEGAFLRLMLHVIPKSHECDVFAWAGRRAGDHPAIPSSPACYGPEHRDRELHQEPHHYRLCGDRTFTLGYDHLRMRVILIDVILKKTWEEGYTVTVQSHSHKAFVDKIVLLSDPLADAVMVPGTNAFMGIQMGIGVIDYGWTGEPGKGKLCKGEWYFGFLLQRNPMDGRWEKVDTTKVIFIDSQETREHELQVLHLLC